MRIRLSLTLNIDRAPKEEPAERETDVYASFERAPDPAPLYEPIEDRIGFTPNRE